MDVVLPDLDKLSFEDLCELLAKLEGLEARMEAAHRAGTLDEEGQRWRRLRHGQLGIVRQEWACRLQPGYERPQ